MSVKNRESTEKKNKIIAILALALFIAILAAVFFFVGKPAMKLVKDTESFRAWVNSNGIWGRVVFVGMVVLQIIVALMPGEPFEICAGFAFGWFEGTLLCLIGSLIGGTLVFLFVKKFGVRLVEVFFSRDKINSLSFLKDAEKRNILFLILFTLPGTPKDLLCYVAGLTDMKIVPWMIISTFGRIPSIITSTVGGSAINEGNYLVAVISFATALAVAAVGILIYRRICRKRADGSENNS